MDWLKLIPFVGNLLSDAINPQETPPPPTPERPSPQYQPFQRMPTAGSASPNVVPPSQMAPIQSPQQAAMASLRQRLGLS